ncbi:MAG: type II toxin-antitoxin system VapC family toxin [Gammaproteobacteria bacterium]
MIVVDASALFEVLLNTEAAPDVATRLFDARETLHAPHLIDVEIAQVLRRYTLSGELEPARGEEVLADLTDFPLTRYPHALFLQRIWDLRRNATAYDAAYLVLAEALGATLVTCDRALASIPGHSARVEVLC